MVTTFSDAERAILRRGAERRGQWPADFDTQPIITVRTYPDTPAGERQMARIGYTVHGEEYETGIPCHACRALDRVQLCALDPVWDGGGLTFLCDGCRARSDVRIAGKARPR